VGIGARREVVIAHFRDGQGAARALIELERRGIPAYGVYVVAAGEAWLLTRLGIAPGLAGAASDEPAAVIVAVAVGCEFAADCLAHLGEHAQAIGVPAAA
jgi:hypothetical protein